MSYFLAVIFGIVLGVIALLAGGLRLHQLLILLAIGATSVFILATHQLRLVLLALLVLTIPINVFSIVPFSQILPYNPSGAPPVLQIRLFDFPLFALLALTMLQLLTGKKPFRFCAIDFAALLMITWGIVTTYNAMRPEFSASELLREFKLYVLARLVVTNIQDERDLRIVIRILLAGAILQGLISLSQYTTNSNFGLGMFTVGELRRVTGTLGWPNTLGAYAAVTFLLGLVSWLNFGGGKWIWTGTPASFMLLILSYSRGAWTATGVGLVLGVLLFWKARLFESRVLTRAITPILGAAILLIGFHNSIIARVGNRSEGIDAIATRMDLNQIATNMINAQPFLGVGLNNYMQVMSEYDTTGISFNIHEPVHNVFFLIGAETGLIGLALFMLLVSLVLLACWRVLNQNSHFLQIHAIGLSCAITALVISNMADVHLKTDGLFAFFWFLIGLILTIQKLSEEQAQDVNQLPETAQKFVLKWG